VHVNPVSSGEIGLEARDSLLQNGGNLEGIAHNERVLHLVEQVIIIWVVEEQRVVASTSFLRNSEEAGVHVSDVSKSLSDGIS